MKILVVNNAAPFAHGGAEELANHLVRNLRLIGEQAELLRIPFSWNPAERLLEEMLICQSFQIENVDRVIALKFPAYLVPFPQKTFWLLHQYRQAYDLWDAGQSNIPATPRGEVIRQAIRAADNQAISEAHHVYVNSRITQERLQHYNGIRSEVLLPPLNDPELFPGGAYGDFLFAGGRVNSGKRQHLLVEAMSHVKRPIRLVVGGPPEGPEDAERLRNLVKRHGLEDRVVLDLGFLPRARVAEYANNALACAYLPFNEDSVGYVTMEACSAGKATLTVSDSGGVLDLVRDEETGFVREPEPKALAEAIDRLAGDPALARRLGANARARWDSLQVTWPHTVEKLLR